MSGPVQHPAGRNPVNLRPDVYAHGLAVHESVARVLVLQYTVNNWNFCEVFTALEHADIRRQATAEYRI